MTMALSHRLLSRPLRVHWAGWESDTGRLQNAGWEISAEQIVKRDYMRLAIRHKLADLRGLSRPVQFPYHSGMDSLFNSDALDGIRLDFNVMSHDIRIREIAETTFSRFAPVDANPQFVEFKGARSLDDLAHFAPLVPVNQLIIPEEKSVNDLLEEIIARQSGARLERITEQVRWDAARPPPLVHASIVSLRRAA